MKYKIGDRVRITNIVGKHSKLTGVTGILERLDSSYDFWMLFDDKYKEFGFNNGCHIYSDEIKLLIKPGQQLEFEFMEDTS